ncbi:hypothetical protein HH310_34045 [Actinoplanes sp. TBRC 11911]|uniref:hypothetical protein n=1 Tax=Actinoplanes sp. TBRC 11911 TaxID=2729386 RepID=UPI00145DBD01|nr:hypothetical protein [Actinoplanes sp. TBRC 11911]NMO56188.1 hypothetical protein [Actinoplanes sp. TBRC 11911]
MGEPESPGRTGGGGARRGRILLVGLATLAVLAAGGAGAVAFAGRNDAASDAGGSPSGVDSAAGPGSPAGATPLPGAPLSDSQLPDGSLPDGSLPDGSLPGGSLTDGPLPGAGLPGAGQPSGTPPGGGLTDGGLPGAGPTDGALPESSPPGTAGPGAPATAEKQALAELERISKVDRGRVAVEGQYVAQLASKNPGITDKYQTAADGSHTFRATDILAEYQALRAGPGNGAARIVLLKSTDYGKRQLYHGKPLYVTFAVAGFRGTQDVLNWCAQRFPRLSGDALTNQCAVRRLRPAS